MLAFTISGIVEHNQNTIATINHQGAYGSNFITILDFFISCCQNWPLSRDFGN